jgi:hypothetical protein
VALEVMLSIAIKELVGYHKITTTTSVCGCSHDVGVRDVSTRITQDQNDLPEQPWFYGSPANVTTEELDVSYIKFCSYKNSSATNDIRF